VVGGVVAQDPVAWIEWYKQSLDAGKALPMPFDDQRAIQHKKAEMENMVMFQTGQPLPVHPYDIHQLHEGVHEQGLIALDEALMMGDEEALQKWQAIQQHNALHAQMQAQLEMQAAVASQSNPNAQGPQGSAAPNPGAPPTAPPSSGSSSPPGPPGG